MQLRSSTDSIDFPVHLRAIRSILLLLLWNSLTLCFTQQLDAQAGSIQFIARSAKLNFVPDEVTCILSIDNGEPFKVLGFALRPAEHGAFSLEEPQYFGARVNVPTRARLLESAFILHGKPERYAFLAPETKPVSELSSHGNSLELLRPQLEQRKEQLKSWKMQAKVQEQSLERLRADAEVIGNLGRLSLGIEERERVLAATVSIKGDIENLKQFLKLASSAPAPINFKRRENMLTKQLADLANAAIIAEKEERQRRSKSESKVRRELALIEETRADDFDQLRRELEQLRSRRKALERRYGVPTPQSGSTASAASPNDDYELPKPVPSE